MTQDFETPELQPRQDPPSLTADFASDDSLSRVEATRLTSDKANEQGVESLSDSDERRALTLAIEIYPDAAANFAARGDYFRQQKDRGRALADYQQALDLAEKELTVSRWALVAQAVRDRVLDILSEMGAS